MNTFGRSRLRALVAASVLALGLVGCGTDSAGPDPIKIGASLPLTGEFSQPGQAALRGYQTWEAMTNESGGLLGRPVKLIYKDDASQQNIIVADYNALISRDKVDLLLGTYSSLLNLPASAVAERNRMLYVEPAGGSPKMFNRGFKLPVLQPAGHRGQNRSGVRELGRRAAGQHQAEDRRLSHDRRPVRRPLRRGHPRGPRKGRCHNGVQRDICPRHQELRHHRQRDEGGQPRPRRARRVLRGRCGHDPLDAACGLHGRTGSTRPPPRRSASSTPTRSAPTTPRAWSTRSVTRRRPTPRATRSSSPSTKRCSANRRPRTPRTHSLPVR